MSLAIDPPDSPDVPSYHLLLLPSQEPKEPNIA